MSRKDYQQEEKLFLAALNSIAGLGPRRLRRLYAQTNSWQACWRSDQKIWNIAKIPLPSQKIWQEKKLSFDINLFNLEFQKNNIELITENDLNYPSGFKNLTDAPLLLYVNGHWPSEQKRIITVIGSRQPSLYGITAANKIIPDLIAAGCSIASGLAIGLDAHAHKLALTNKGHTIAILGSGLNNIYPPQNRRLATEIIAQGGLVLSEYSPTTPPRAGNFLQRNRLLAAISDATLVLEANLSSGSMNTAKQAKILQKKVYAVPGNIFSQQAAGCHQLIKEGAQLVNNSKDIIMIDINKNKNKSKKITLNLQEKAIINLLQTSFYLFSGLRSDEIQKHLKLDTVSVNSTLSILEIKNLIRQQQGRYYFLPPESQNQC